MDDLFGVTELADKTDAERGDSVGTGDNKNSVEQREHALEQGPSNDSIKPTISEIEHTTKS